MTEFEALLLGELRAASTKHPERARDLTRDYVQRLRALHREERELAPKEYAHEHGYEVRTVWKAIREGRLVATKRRGVWRIPSAARIATRGTKATTRMRVVHCHKSGLRWSIELECGHTKLVTSPGPPQHGTCECAQGAERKVP